MHGRMSVASLASSSIIFTFCASRILLSELVPVPVKVDSRASISMYPNKDHFVEPMACPGIGTHLNGIAKSLEEAKKASY